MVEIRWRSSSPSPHASPPSRSLSTEMMTSQFLGTNWECWFFCSPISTAMLLRDWVPLYPEYKILLGLPHECYTFLIVLSNQVQPDRELQESGPERHRQLLLRSRRQGGYSETRQHCPKGVRPPEKKGEDTNHNGMEMIISFLTPASSRTP